MSDKITSVAELRRAIDQRAISQSTAYIMALLDEFEVELRERIKHLENFSCEENAVNELRRVLGEGGSK